jgi:hypothetical protein
LRHFIEQLICVLEGAREPTKWRAAVSTALAAALVGLTAAGPMPAMADLNKFEAEQRGEFGIGSAAQFGSADLKYDYGNSLTYLFSDTTFHLDYFFPTCI